MGAALVVALDVALTGALHLDAVADTADGLASRRPREQALAVMREPQVGAVGAVAVGVLLLLRFAWIAALAAAASWALLAVAPVCGRAAMVLALCRGESHRAELGGRPSLAAGTSAAATRAVAAGALLLATAVAALAGLLGAGPQGAAVAVSALVVAALIALLAERAWRARFGSFTGDATGSAGMLAELGALAVLAALAVG